MSDIFSKSKRSEIMSKISGKETKPEIIVRKYLFAKGFRYRKNLKKLPGKPDIVLPKYKTIILIHGCFWHGHEGCKKSVLPTTNTEFWKEKIGKNIERDRFNILELEKQGWKVIVVWQCELKNSTVKNIRLVKLTNEISFRDSIIFD
jgi:DNA mismatch endonuclease (patch repair protein)